MYSVNTTATDKQIKALQNEAAEHGDDAQWCIATVALEGWDSDDPATRFEARFGGGGHELSRADEARISRMTQDEARAECARAIADAEAQS
jgi:hypothetical protein